MSDNQILESKINDPEKNILGIIVMPVVVSLILIIALYNLIIKGETQYIQFSLIFSFCPVIIREIPAIARYRYLQFVFIILAFTFFGMEIYFNWYLLK